MYAYDMCFLFHYAMPWLIMYFSLNMLFYPTSLFALLFMFMCMLVFFFFSFSFFPFFLFLLLFFSPFFFGFFLSFSSSLLSFFFWYVTLFYFICYMSFFYWSLFLFPCEKLMIALLQKYNLYNNLINQNHGISVKICNISFVTMTIIINIVLIYK